MFTARNGVRTLVLLVAALTAMATSVADAAAPIGMLKQFRVPTANSGPRGVAQGSDGNIWFTEGNVPTVGRITPRGSITEFSNVCVSCFPNDIVQGPNNILYFTTNDPGLGRITTSGQLLTPVAPTNPPFADATLSNGNGMATFGNNIWYAGFNTNSIWRFNTATSAFTEFVPPTAGSDPYDVAVDANGNVWFTEQVNNGQIGRIDAQTGAITETILTRVPRQITVATDGSVWFTERFANGVGHLIPSTNTAAECNLAAGAGPEGIAAAPDGSVWITQSDAGNVARVTQCPAGGMAVTAQGPTVSASQPFGVTVPTTGNVWYAEISANKIAVLNPK
jgi:streptogramin lyase